MTLRRQFSVVIEKTLRELRGTSCMELDDARAPRQQILVSRSFGTPIMQVDGILEAVSEFASRAAERLRQQGRRRRHRRFPHHEPVSSQRSPEQRQRDRARWCDRPRAVRC